MQCKPAGYDLNDGKTRGKFRYTVKEISILKDKEVIVMKKAIDADALIEWIDQDWSGSDADLLSHIKEMPESTPVARPMLNPEDKVLLVCSYAPRCAATEVNLLRLVTAEEGTVIWAHPDEIIQPDYCR